MKKSIAAAVSFLLVTGAPLRAQQTPPTPTSRDSMVDTLVVPRPPALPLATSPSALLDLPIDRSRYVLGPGDVVNLAIFGELSRTNTLAVGPEGTLLIPTVGLVDVLGLTLDQAEGRVRETVARYYRNVTVRLTLAQVRSFKVFVLGAVDQPGVRTATSASRVSEVIPASATDSVVHRNILLRRANGDSLRVDLVRFLQLGDLDANPRLREGDALIVNPIQETVRVVGAVAFPGTYEYRKGETLAALLEIANGGGGFPPNAADTLRLTRLVAPGRQEVTVLSRAEAVGERGRGLVLKPFDALYIPGIGDYDRRHVARVEGQVVHPGTYPIVPGVTTVRDLVNAAGGFLPDASLVTATLRRTPEGMAEKGLEQLKNAPVESLSKEERQILQIRSGGDETNVVIDFEQLFRQDGDAADQTLRSGDVLTVPRRRDDVVVLGAVARPGIVDFVPGQKPEAFVRAAGGYSSRADKHDVTILKAKLGTRASIRDVKTIEPGDQIIIPFKERHTFSERIQTAAGLTTALSGMILTIYGLGRLW
ncbi:MAG: SLBB domain-containing protein [Gemmatimonadetes bacterium]|nr:SLBB domain-containing protein [Gemmatimonadota bacterium]